MCGCVNKFTAGLVSFECFLWNEESGEWSGAKGVIIAASADKNQEQKGSVHTSVSGDVAKKKIMIAIRLIITHTRIYCRIILIKGRGNASKASNY